MPKSDRDHYSFDLDSNQLYEVNSILSRGDPRKMYSCKFGYNIYLRDLQTLRNGTWLNDNVLPVYGVDA